MGTSRMYGVFRDRLLLKATLLNAAVHLDNLYQRPASVMTLGYREETISMVNQMVHIRWGGGGAGITTGVWWDLSQVDYLISLTSHSQRTSYY